MTKYPATEYPATKYPMTKYREDIIPRRQKNVNEKIPPRQNDPVGE